jgi:hypothetical protein
MLRVEDSARVVGELDLPDVTLPVAWFPVVSNDLRLAPDDFKAPKIIARTSAQANLDLLVFVELLGHFASLHSASRAERQAVTRYATSRHLQDLTSRNRNLLRESSSEPPDCELSAAAQPSCSAANVHKLPYGNVGVKQHIAMGIKILMGILT